MKEKQTLAGMTKLNKKMEGNPMKKIAISLFAVALSIMVLLTACDNGNANTNADPNANPNANSQNSHQEQLAGVIQVIDGMQLTIDTSGVFVANETGSHIVSGEDEPVENQEINIRLTDETIIKVETVNNGQITGTKAGTLDDLSLQNIVTVDGEWQGDEFVATELLVFAIENPMIFN